MGFGPTTSSLARRRSTAELLPLKPLKNFVFQGIPFFWCRGGDLNSYGLCPPPPQDGASTDSATSAQEWKDSNPQPALLEF
jgi:hypothetical protein